MKGKGGNKVLSSCTHTKTTQEFHAPPPMKIRFGGLFPFSLHPYFISPHQFWSREGQRRSWGRAGHGAEEVMEVDDFIGKPL
jgi:hypothetical protein